jgi:uncharacterized protein YneF (UPF0154 family)
MEIAMGLLGWIVTFLTVFVGGLYVAGQVTKRDKR